MVWKCQITIHSYIITMGFSMKVFTDYLEQYDAGFCTCVLVYELGRIDAHLADYFKPEYQLGACYEPAMDTFLQVDTSCFNAEQQEIYNRAVLIAEIRDKVMLILDVYEERLRVPATHTDLYASLGFICGYAHNN